MVKRKRPAETQIEVTSTRKLRLIPVYFSSTTASSPDGDNAAARGMTLPLPATLGRVNLCECWWNSCPNHCQAGPPNFCEPCLENCFPVRRSSHRDCLSQRMIEVDPNGRINVVARHGQLVHFKGNLETGETCQLIIGKPGKQPFLRFDLRLVRAVTPPSASAWLTSKPSPKKKRFMLKNLSPPEEKEPSPSKKSLFSDSSSSSSQEPSRPRRRRIRGKDRLGVDKSRPAVVIRRDLDDDDSSGDDDNAKKSKGATTTHPNLVTPFSKSVQPAPVVAMTGQVPKEAAKESPKDQTKLEPKAMTTDTSKLVTPRDCVKDGKTKGYRPSGASAVNATDTVSTRAAPLAASTSATQSPLKYVEESLIVLLETQAPPGVDAMMTQQQLQALSEKSLAPLATQAPSPEKKNDTSGSLSPLRLSGSTQPILAPCIQRPAPATDTPLAPTEPPRTVRKRLDFSKRRNRTKQATTNKEKEESSMPLEKRTPSPLLSMPLGEPSVEQSLSETSMKITQQPHWNVQRTASPRKHFWSDLTLADWNKLEAAADPDVSFRQAAAALVVTKNQQQSSSSMPCNEQLWLPSLFENCELE